MGGSEGTTDPQGKEPRRNKTLYCGVDPHSNNGMYVIADQEERPLFRKRWPNTLPEAVVEPVLELATNPRV
jgi:hypothetical protein